MKTPSRFLCMVTLLFGLFLVMGAMALVHVNFRSRTLHIENERAMSEHQRLLDDRAELLMRARSASLPGRILDVAGTFGLAPVKRSRTVILSVERAEQLKKKNQKDRTP